MFDENMDENSWLKGVDQDQIYQAAGALPLSKPLLRFASNDDLERERKAKNQTALTTIQHNPVIAGLSAHVDKCWQAAKTAKMDIEPILLQCLRQIKGEYDPEDLAIIRATGGAEVYMQLTSIKCRSVESSIKDVMLPAGEKAWTIQPTPVPTVKQDIDMIVNSALQQQLQMIMQENPMALQQPGAAQLIEDAKAEIRKKVEDKVKADAAEIASQQENYIEDCLVEGGFEKAMSEFIRDFKTYPAAFIEGPIVKKRKRLIWSVQPDGQTILPVAQDVLRREYECFSPFDAFPSPGAKSVDDGYFFRRKQLRIRDIMACMGTPGYKDDAIAAVCAVYSRGHIEWTGTDYDRAVIENRAQEQNDPEAIIEGLMFYGYVQGQMLIDWGMDATSIPLPEQEYNVKVLKIGAFIVMARLNAHPLGHRGIYSSSYEPMNGAIWAKGPPQMMRDSQRVCNAASRNLVNNMGIASGPQVEVHMDRLHPTEDPESIYAWKIWKTFSDKAGSNREAVYFYQPDMVAEPLMAIFDKFYLLAGEQVGVPAYEHGSMQTEGAGSTARGLSMLMVATSKVMKEAIRGLDSNITIPIIQDTWIDLVMNDDIPVSGDINIVAKASEYLTIYDKLTQMRREWLQITNNPTDMAIIGFRGRAKVLRETARALRMPDDVIPSDTEIMQMLGAPQQQQEDEHGSASKDKGKSGASKSQKQIPQPSVNNQPNEMSTIQ